MKQIIVEANEAGQRLDKLLSKVLNKAPKSFIYKMLRKKNITLNGKKAEGSEKLEVRDEIKLFLSEETIEQFSETIETNLVECDFPIVYEDKHVLVANKPLGVLSQKAEPQDISMVEYIISYLLSSGQLSKEQLKTFKPGICNRLDRNTGGLLIAGKSLLGLQEMSKLLKDRSLDKYYLCIVKGKLEGKKRIEGYLYKDEKNNQVSIHSMKAEHMDYICTEYEPQAFSKNITAARKELNKGLEPSLEELPQGVYTLLQVKLITGRSHQIRAHLASIGHPIVGDFKYGDQKTNHYFKKKYNLSHQLLHSYRMVFPMINGELSYLSGKELQAEVPMLFETIKRDLF